MRVGSSHGHEAQRIGREHVVAVCAERIAKVVIGLHGANLPAAVATASSDLVAARTCCICYDEFDVSAGIECGGSEKHFCCTGAASCFARYIQSRCNMEQLDALAERQGSVSCPMKAMTGCDAPCFTMAEIQGGVSQADFLTLCEVKDSILAFLGKFYHRGDASAALAVRTSHSNGRETIEVHSRV
eukprot:SAG25_NODE_1706_length_2507_cov_2.964286_5_plen_186_part_00